MRDGTGTIERSGEGGEGGSHGEASGSGDLPLCLEHSVQFQVINVLLDPGLTGVGADLFPLFGLKSAEEGMDRLEPNGTLSVVAVSLCLTTVHAGQL